MCVALGSSVPSKERSDTSRSSIKGEFVISKPKALLVSTFRGVPFLFYYSVDDGLSIKIHILYPQTIFYFYFY